jgi:phospholipid transport system substrate-binding protein
MAGAARAAPVLGTIAAAARVTMIANFILRHSRTAHSDHPVLSFTPRGSILRHARFKELIMRYVLLAQSNASQNVIAIKSLLSSLSYRCMAALRVLSPYLFAAFFVVLSQDAHAATPAETFVQQNIDNAYALLNDMSLSRQERSGRLRTLLASIMDSKRVGLFTLGSYARGASEAQIQDFSDAFSEFVVTVLQRDVAGMPGETLTVTGSVARAPDDVIVNAKLSGSQRTNGSTIKMAFRILKDANGADTLVDVQIEGISMAVAQRSDFTSWLQQHHGDISALTRELHNRTQKLRLDDAPPQSARTASAR